uniref:Uncharacterized protein n=2 Tax=Ditylum brightwellii TaxID=49249 RepID=A0A7S1Z2D0_9STRA|mmetsp:Transcript_21410/g.28143  ORF Transcript_21410/g.28143 Transcript_21410/m.28143 type:complete len:131 (+) Transcript_21410:1-393(+)
MALASDMMSCDNGMDARDCHMAVDQKNDSKTMHERGKDAEEALARHAQHYFPASQQTCLTTSETNCCHSTKTIREMQSQINVLVQQMTLMLSLLEEQQTTIGKLNTKLDELGQTNVMTTINLAAKTGAMQ